MGGQYLPRGGEAYEHLSNAFAYDYIRDVSRFDTKDKAKVAHPSK